MASTYSDLKIELIGTGEQAGTWGATTNTNLGTAVEEAISGSADVTFSSADVTLTLTNANTTQTARNIRLNLVGTSGGARQLILGSGCQINKPYLINNGLSDAVTVKNTTGTGIAVPAGKSMWVFNNGTNVVDAVTHLSSLTLSSALPATSGGTAQTSYTTGDIIYASGANTLAKRSIGTTGQVLTVSGGVPAWTTLSGGGSVTSVDVSGGTTGLTTSGGPITSSGTITLAGTLAATNGGTAQTSYTTGDMIYASGTNTLAKRSIGTTGQVLTVSGGVPTWATPSSGGGAVVQRIVRKSTTTTSTSSTSYQQASGFDGALTITATGNNYILVRAYISYFLVEESGVGVPFSAAGGLVAIRSGSSVLARGIFENQVESDGISISTIPTVAYNQAVTSGTSYTFNLAIACTLNADIVQIGEYIYFVMEEYS